MSNVYDHPSGPQSPANTALAPLGNGGGLLALQEDRERFVQVNDPDRFSTDGYLRLTAHILMQSQRQQFRTIGVISSRDGEGRSAAAANLSVCLARARGRTGNVLLVDGDARRRTLSRLLCGRHEQNRTDVYYEDPGDTAKHPEIFTTSFPGLDIMTAPEAADALTIHDPAAWAHTFHELKFKYAQIVIDCPSILDNPEGMVLRDCVEELVLVVESGQTSKKTIERALGGVRRRVIGVILNGGVKRRQAKKATSSR